MRLCRICLVVTVVSVLPCALRAAWLENVPQTIRQPDGREVQCFATGDEYNSRLHDGRNFTIVRDSTTGYYVYATALQGELIHTAYVVGSVDPARVGLIPGAMISTAKMRQRREALMLEEQAAATAQSAPRFGTINNIVIFIRFNGEAEFTEAVSRYDNMFNAPSGSSLRSYYWESSYNNLTIGSTFYPKPPGTTVISYMDANPRAYYMPYDASTNSIGYQSNQRYEREHALLKAAIAAVAPQIPIGLAVDNDHDGNVDNVVFVLSGSPTAWNTLLWPHKNALTTYAVYLNGARVMTYNFQLQTVISVGVLCHEMGHSLGAPDLYHYSYDGFYPAGYWDLMGYQTDPPQHMGAYMKMKYGTWIGSIPQITSAGTYALNPLTSSTGNCYRIASPYTTSEYFVLEYRRRQGLFESQIPGEGLLVYRINTARAGNSLGPPDEVYVYRPGGTPATDGSHFLAGYSSNSGRTAIDDGTSPSSFLTNGNPGGLRISDVGALGSTISFRVSFGETPTITGITPSLKTAGDPAFTIEVYGSNFLPNSIVRFNGADRATTFVSETHVQAAIPAGDVALQGSFSVAVFNPGSGLSNASPFTVQASPEGSVAISVRNQDWVPAGPWAMVDLYNSAGELVATAPTNASSLAAFSHVASKPGYWYRVRTLYQPVKINGEEYWGKKEGIVVAGGQVTNDAFKRNAPFAQGIKVFLATSNLEVTGPVTIGTPLRIDLAITNPADAGAEIQQVKARISLDRNMVPPYDFSDSTSYQKYATGETKLVSFFCTPADTGTYRSVTGVVVQLPGARVTDGGEWTTLFDARPAIPAPPSLVFPADGASGVSSNPALTWIAAAWATSYHLQLARDSSFLALDFGDSSLTSNTKQVTGLPKGTTYYWRARAKNPTGNGPWSRTRKFTTALALPGVLTLLAPGPDVHMDVDTVRLVWSRGSPEVNVYRVEVATDSAFAFSNMDSTVTDTFRVIRSLKSGPTYYWQVSARNSSGWGAVSETRKFSAIYVAVADAGGLPTETRLHQNYPNPFNPVTTIEYTVPGIRRQGSGVSQVRLAVYDVLGQEVAVLVDGREDSGSHAIRWNGGSFPSGVYICRLTVGGHVAVRKMVLAK